MADYEAAARSNYFNVKNRPRFEAEIKRVFSGMIQVVEGRKGDGLNEGRIALYTESLVGEWPTEYDEDADEDRTVWQVVAPHLGDGEVAVFVEAGHEKRRYVGGYAIAVNNQGKERRVDLRDIYKKAEKLGDVVTEALY